jgi:membrane protein
MSFPLPCLPQAWNWGGLSFKELAVRTYEALDKHETIDRAAIVAFYAMLALVPFLGLVLTITLGASGGVVADEILSLSRRFLPEAADQIVRNEVHTIREGPRVGIVSVSFLILLWSASSAFVAVMDSTNAAYGVRDGRAWWKRRLMAVVLTVVESLLLVGASFLIAAWPWLLSRFGLDSVAAAAATAVQWLVVVVALLASFAIAYYFGTHIEQEWEWITPGSTIGVLVLIMVNLGFRAYLHYGADVGATYGALAGVVLMLLWLYLAALALLVGSEINCVIEHAAPHGKVPVHEAPAPVTRLTTGSPRPD